MKRLTERSDAALVKQTLSGAPTGFELLVERHAGTARAMALAHVRTYSDAEDVVQEAFVEAFRCLDTLREPARCGARVTTGYILCVFDRSRGLHLLMWPCRDIARTLLSFDSRSLMTRCSFSDFFAGEAELDPAGSAVR